jgi:hypothetical protein
MVTPSKGRIPVTDIGIGDTNRRTRGKERAVSGRVDWEKTLTVIREKTNKNNILFIA